MQQGRKGEKARERKSEQTMRISEDVLPNQSGSQFDTR
jgi:hypothetical protein